MKNAKKLFTGFIVAMAFAATTVTAFAASANTTPAEVVAGITGRTTDSIIEERIESDKTYGSIAIEAGKLDEFKSEMLEIKKENLAALVEAGTITQEKADAILKAIEENQAVCDGTGSAKFGRNLGAGFGFKGTDRGLGGANCGPGMGRGQGGGRNMNNGLCIYQ